MIISIYLYSIRLFLQWPITRVLGVQKEEYFFSLKEMEGILTRSLRKGFIHRDKLLGWEVGSGDMGRERKYVTAEFCVNVFIPGGEGP